MAITAAAILCFAIGFLLVALVVGRCGLRGIDLALRICLSAGFGLAVFSFTYFLARISGFMRLWIIDFGVLAILQAGYLIAKGRQQQKDHLPNRVEQNSAPRLLTGAFLLALFVAVYSAVIRALGHPYGSGWDSFAIWNLHARFLYRGGSHWRDGFSALIPWSHPDYPLLLPAAIAHFWTIAGHETSAIPAIIGLIFTFATVGLLFAALDILVGRTSALLGGLALLCSPFFVELGTWQYADVPLSFFILATLVLFHLSDNLMMHTSGGRGVLALAGFAAGCAAWTKNEGILFLSAVFFARLLVRFQQRRSGSLQLLPALYGLIPVLCVVLFFKHSIAPPGDLFSDWTTMVRKIGEAWRYGVVLKWYGKEFLRFGGWLVVPVPILMLVFYLMIMKTVAIAGRASVRPSAIALGLTLAGYFFIYLITPYDIYWHLRFSLARLLVQLWPSAIFLFFLRLGPVSVPAAQGQARQL
jgi:Dolichyl-phosphate-mannose-protein mannosyltransferase